MLKKTLPKMKGFLFSMHAAKGIATGCRKAVLYKMLLLFNLIERVFDKLDIEY